LFWLLCLYLTYALWGLVAAIFGVMILGVGIFITAALALLFHGDFLLLVMLLLTLGVIYALRILGLWFVESREGGDEFGRNKIIPIVAFIIIGIFIVMSVGLTSALTSNSNQVDNQSRKNPFESLNSFELDKFSVVMAAAQEKPLADSDFENLRAALKSYVDRTGNYLTKNDIDILVGVINKSNDYQYELGQSLLFSWDQHEVFTTNRFDELYKEMQKDDCRKPELLQADKNRIQEAARNQNYTEDASRNKYEFSREIILENLGKIDIARKNFEKIVDVFNEFVK
jgi:NADH:ubiquinone oxidoreductase subunit 6 (subunit J)